MLIIIGAATVAALSAVTRPPIDAAPDVVEIAPHPFLYPLPGEFTDGRQAVEAPTREQQPRRALAIMKRQVTSAEYRRCVSGGGCPDVPGLADDADRPAVMVSWRDATAYAAWLSRRLGATYRLPTDEEWAFAAGSRFRGNASAAAGDNPGEIALRRYEWETALAAEVDAEPRNIGAFGANEMGVLDLAGNVWEWTETCYRHELLSAAATAAVVNCGIRIAEGRHRAYLPDFLREARAGGCATGTPPANLGFRLVREVDATRWWETAYFLIVAS